MYVKDKQAGTLITDKECYLHNAGFKEGMKQNYFKERVVID